MELIRGHEHLTALHRGVLSVVGVDIETDFRLNHAGDILLKNMSVETANEFNDYLVEISSRNGYLSQCYEWYRHDIDKRLNHGITKSNRAPLIWMLSSYASAKTLLVHNSPNDVIPREPNYREINLLANLGKPDKYWNTRANLGSLTLMGILQYKDAFPLGDILKKKLKLKK
jgi:hypothetical protein